MTVAAFHSKLRFEDDGGFPLTLIEPLVYVSALLGGTIVVPAGFKTDLASIPRPLWAILPPIGKYDAAAVIHDALYQWGSLEPQRAGHVVDRAQADAVLREAMTACRVRRTQRWAIYAGVRLGGAFTWRRYRRSANA